MFYLTATARRKGAKKHIILKSKDICKLRYLGNDINERYIVEIYNGKWELVETVRG